MARLVTLDGADRTKSHALGDAPATIGFAPDCTIRLPDGEANLRERVRLWRRDGKYMLHRLSRRGRVAVGGRSVTWAVLEDGDEIEIGPYRLRFQVEPAQGGPPGFLKRKL